MNDTHSPHPLTPSPSGRGGTQEQGREVFYRLMASKVLVQIARDLRQRETPAETLLWEALRNRRLANLKFRRQHPIANTAYVADFLCYTCKLVIELDGGIHTIQQTDDALREETIAAQGYRILRFRNEDILDNLEDVLTTILLTADSPPRPEGEGAGG